MNKSIFTGIVLQRIGMVADSGFFTLFPAGELFKKIRSLLRIQIISTDINVTKFLTSFYIQRVQIIVGTI